MTKKEIIDYVMNTPYNTNPAILSQMLDEIAGEGGGGDSWTMLTEESVTTLLVPSMDYARRNFEYSQIINTDFIRVTLNGTAYVCQRSVNEYGDNVYGAAGSPGTYDWSEFPFQILSGDDDGIFTTLTVPTAGTYNIKIESPQSGGGSSDFSMATVTIIRHTEFYVNAPIVGSEYASIGDFEFIITGDLNHGDTDIVLYRGSALAEVTYDPSLNLEMTAIGAIEKIDEGEGFIAYKITGDCTITDGIDNSGDDLVEVD